jgi:hypothetical protein
MRWRRPNIKRGRKLCRQRLPRNRVSASGSLRSSATPPATLGSTALHYMQRRVRGQSWGPRRSTILAESFKDEAYLNAIVRDAPQATASAIWDPARAWVDRLRPMPAKALAIPAARPTGYGNCPISRFPFAEMNCWSVRRLIRMDYWLRGLRDTVSTAVITR